MHVPPQCRYGNRVWVGTRASRCPAPQRHRSRKGLGRRAQRKRCSPFNVLLTRRRMHRLGGARPSEAGHDKAPTRNGQGSKCAIIARNADMTMAPPLMRWGHVVLIAYRQHSQCRIASIRPSGPVAYTVPTGRFWRSHQTSQHSQLRPNATPNIGSTRSNNSHAMCPQERPWQACPPFSETMSNCRAAAIAANWSWSSVIVTVVFVFGITNPLSGVWVDWP